MKEHKHAEILRAIADGREVEYRHSEMDRCEWTSIGCYEINPIHFPEWEWRIKPEPKPSYVVKGNVRFSQDFGTCGRSWQFVVNVTMDGDTDQPISVEIVK